MLYTHRPLVPCGLFLAIMLAATPAFSQADLTGVWGARYQEDQPERIPGPPLVDYLGLPMNDAARQWALSWNPLRLEAPEHQCQVHTAAYIYRGRLQLRIWEQRDPESQELVAIKQYINTYEQERTIWMDGRPHPSANAPHTWMGFSTGEWNGSMLTVTTTHIKQGWTRRNGFPSSDRITLREHFIRHGDQLVHIDYRPGSRFSVRAAHQDPELRADDERNRQLAVAVRIRRRIGGSETGRRARSYMPGENPFTEEFANAARPAARRDARRRQDDVSRVSERAERLV